METRFHGLPPLKRFRLMQEEQQKKETQYAAAVSFPLPAKKRKEAWDLHPPAAVCLPAKKRIWAVQPNLVPDEETSAFDLNKPPVGDQGNRDEIAEGENEDDENGGEEEEEDDGIECAVCQSTDGDPSDPIVFCDGCDLMVHATCFGSPLINGVPEGDWFCAQCSASQPPQPGAGASPFSCCLCPAAGGAMKPTTDGRWAHIVCALFVPEVFFSDPEGREDIDCSKVPVRRFEQSCYLCKTANGCAIDCSEPKCPLAFHVSCGLKEGLCVEYRESRAKGAIVAGFCKGHTELWKKQQQTGKFKIVARDETKE
ncbi:uncharacterized protein LOC127792277 [Diospyros lotus]|uniref:uncharacterized protein LOC127792277 n=1 Tax=Diospyros lotus TaxID=55363 RepID=UPI00225A0845|nr:uncharacterized protein LOC127792277 [Diospyros lotus]